MDKAFLVRRANPSDAAAIAEAHVDSIRSVGARFYPAAIVNQWGAPRDGTSYVKALEQGEVIFIAIPSEASDGAVLGFSSCRIEKDQYRIAVYVRGAVSRQGVGSALFQAAEDVARERGANQIHVDASLAAVQFYRANGFETIGSGEHLLSNGARMACVFMRKAVDR